MFEPYHPEFLVLFGLMFTTSENFLTLVSPVVSATVFLTVLFLSAYTVVYARKPLFNILGLASVFILGGGAFAVLASEFFGLVYIMVYVGAIVVLFLFVVMLLDLRYTTFGAQSTLGLISGAWGISIGGLSSFYIISPSLRVQFYALGSSNFELSGLEFSGFFFTNFASFIGLCGLVLFIILVGIVLLLTEPNAKSPLLRTLYGDLFRQVVSLRAGS